MYVISVNIGRSVAIKNAKASGHTGIYKRPVTGPVEFTTNGVADDVIIDVENHGGVDQAVYVFGQPDYQWWSEEIGRELEPGTFGENLTLSGLESARLMVGDRFHIGTTILEVTAPRIPCVTLAVRMGEPAFLKRFRAAERPGAYCRVIQEGHIEEGDQVEFEPFGEDGLSIIEMFRYFYAPDHQEATLRRHLAAPIAIRDRVDKEQQLEKLLAQRST